MNDWSAAGYELVAITERSGFDESCHFGAAVGLDRDGSVAWAVGDPDQPVYGRSSNKPMQATAMVGLGLEVPDDLLALVCASHSGTPRHTAGVLDLLGRFGHTVDDLGNTAGLPLDESSAREVFRSGGGPAPLTMNCSGKHAGMLATCAINGWPTAGYLDQDHPLQTAITTAVTELSGAEPAHVGVDGCGAPAHVVALSGLAAAFRRIAVGDDPSQGAVGRAMSSCPFEVGGPGRDVTAFMQGIPGLVAKDGADGVFAAALPDGRALALKIADGGDRARPPVFAAGLRALGIDAEPLRDVWDVPVLGHGRAVGRVRAAGRITQLARL